MLTGRWGSTGQMRGRSLPMIGFAALAMLLSGGPATRAENDTDLVRDPTLQRGGFFPRSAPRIQNRKRPQVKVAPVQVRRPTPSATTTVETPVILKPDASRFVVVIGDTLGALLAGGLDDALSDRADIAVIQKTRTDSGLVRNDVYDWPKAVRELLDSNQKITLAVMLIGSNDRQSIREGDQVHEPFSERWKTLYLQRIDDIAMAFAEKRIPLLWVGAPPAQLTRLSADLIILNEMFRQRVERAGGTFVDLWGGFVDAENRYTATGPDVSGQIARLRTGDGVHFTRAGARKAAHFADVAIRRLLEGAPPAGVIALPAAVVHAPPDRELQPGGIERLIDAMVSGLPDATRLATIPVKPVAGPVFPLNSTAAMTVQQQGDGALLARSSLLRGRSDNGVLLERIFTEGAPPDPKTGRADDHRWPKAGN